jgi:hypothetical protein
VGHGQRPDFEPRRPRLKTIACVMGPRD